MEEREFDYLNVIPLVDVMLVLLTIVLTTSTFIVTGGIQVELPKASSDEQTSSPHSLTITLDQTGSLWLNGENCTQETLQARLDKTERSTPLLIRADKTLALQNFVDVFAAIKGLGFTKLSLQTEHQP